MSEGQEPTVVDVGVDTSGIRIVSVSFRDTKRRFEWDEVCRALLAYDDLVRACKLSLEWLDEVCNPETEPEWQEQEGIEARYNIEAALLKAGVTP